MPSATAPEGSNKLARFLFGLAVIGVPASAAVFFSTHPILAAFVAEAFVLATSFVAKVWDKLETQWVDAIAKWASPKMESLVTRYTARFRRGVYFQYRSFDVKGLNTYGSISLELDQVFVEVNLSLEAPHKVSANPLRAPREAATSERREIWDLLKDENCRHLAVLGPPGSGKTTLLKHVALALVGPRRSRPVRKTPVLLSLRDLAGEIRTNPQFTLADAFRKFPPSSVASPAGWIENQLASGKCIILLDGLDEVADTSNRFQVAAWVEQRLKDHGENRFVITSRPHGYLANPLEGVTVLDVLPFSWPQVEQFVNNWYMATETVRRGKRDRGVDIAAKTEASDLLRLLGAAPALTDLAVNPLLLTMITTVHKERKSLPGRRVELYNEICEVFLGKRQASKGLVVDLTPAQKRRVLEPLAWYLMCVKRGEIPTSDAHVQIAPALSLVSPSTTPDNFLHDICNGSGILVEKENDQYAFAHLTFQEYLAASYVRTQHLEQQLAIKVDEPWWAETIRLYAAQADATTVVESCLAIDPPTVQALVLAVDCLGECLEIAAGTRTRVQQAAVAGLEDSNARRRRIAAEVLLTQFVNSMVRIAEGRYVSLTLVPNAVYEMFLGDRKDIRPPSHWENGRFPAGQSRVGCVGVAASAAMDFCEWLSDRQSGWSYRIPAGDKESALVGHWIHAGDRRQATYRTQADWISRAREAIEQRLTREDYLDGHFHFASRLVLREGIARAFEVARGDEPARKLDLLLTYGLSRDLAHFNHFGRPYDFARNLTHALTFGHYRNFGHNLARALAYNLACAVAFSRSLGGDRDVYGWLDRHDIRSRTRQFCRDTSTWSDTHRILSDDLKLYYDLDLDLYSNLDLDRELDVVRRLEFDVDLDFDVPFHLGADMILDDAVNLAFRVGREDPHFGNRIELASMLMLTILRPGQPAANLFGRLFLAAAIELEQAAGRIPPIPVGILLVRDQILTPKLSSK